MAPNGAKPIRRLTEENLAGEFVGVLDLPWVKELNVYCIPSTTDYAGSSDVNLTSVLFVPLAQRGGQCGSQ